MIMFVCTGNTCRSPMAEGILLSMLRSEGLDHTRVLSSGTGTLNGYPATTNSVLAASDHDIDISEHHSRSLNTSLVERSDLIFALAYDHFIHIMSRYPEAEGKLFMLKAFPDAQPSPEMTIADPIGADFEVYENVFNEIDKELKRIFPAIRERIASKHAK